MPQEEESRKIAKRAVKISLFCVGIVLIFAVITLYVLITQIRDRKSVV